MPDVLQIGRLGQGAKAPTQPKPAKLAMQRQAPVLSISSLTDLCIFEKYLYTYLKYKV